MKTKIRTFIAVCIFSFAATTAASASTTETGNNLMAFATSESLFTLADFQAEAQLVNKWIADQEEAKTIQKLMNDGFQLVNETNSDITDYTLTTAFSELSNINFREDAQLVTKSIADQKEAIAIARLVEEGKIAENR
jgi:predicted Zn-dependent peptidase